ncbi:MAG TPA: MFS transporter [Steroidobacteraceae bacterium]|nr:MFS transporter [Steroidobacteraceae bacterium]
MQSKRVPSSSAPEPSGRHAVLPWPLPRRGWLVAALLGLASIGSQFDRTVINLMVAPLKAAFSLDDTHFGMLQGVAFGIFYVLACVPIGYLADRFQRRTIIGVGIGLFSLLAMASGLARSYAQLFLTRIGVAVGEASLTPAALSMLSDLFPPEELGRPVSAFFMSAPVGQGLAFIAGGSLLQWLSTSTLLRSGPLSGLAAWQAAFIIVGFPVVLLVPFLFLQPEPLRRGSAGAASLPLKEVATIIRERSPALVPMFAGFAMVNLVSYTFFIWTPALFERSYGWNPAQIGVSFGLILLIAGTSGVYFAGWLADRLARRGDLDAHLKAAAFGFVGCGLLGALAPLMPNALAAQLLLAPAIFLSMMPYPCAGTAIQLIVPNRARAQVTAIYVTLTTLVGLGVGPFVVGTMTDRVFRDPSDIRYSLALVIGIAVPLMFVLLLIARRPYRALRAQPHPRSAG